MHMSILKNNKDINLYYSDTDSGVTDKPLPSFLVDEEELGKFKLENKFKQGVFLAPKVYGGILISGEEYIKLKGSKNIISFNQLKILLKENELLMIPQEKWYRDLPNGQIKVSHEQYTLMITENKRKVIYENGLFTRTEPLKINYEKIINL